MPMSALSYIRLYLYMHTIVYTLILLYVYTAYMPCLLCDTIILYLLYNKICFFFICNAMSA